MLHQKRQANASFDLIRRALAKPAKEDDSCAEKMLIPACSLVYNNCDLLRDCSCPPILNPQNHNRRISMLRKGLFSLFLGVAVACCLSPAFAQTNDEAEIFDLINRERGKHRLGGLDWDDRLAKLARSYSRQMAREGFFDHYDPSGNSIIERAQAASINDWRKIGENLFYSENISPFSGVAVRGWMKSPSHRRNILDGSWTATGIGVAKARDGSIYVTQLFKVN